VEARVAVEESAAAFPSWGRGATTPADRAAFLTRWHAAILAAADDVATIMSVECGKPRGEARAEVASAAASVLWCAGEAVRVDGELPSPLTGRGRRGVVLRTPVGPAGLITPWNFPASMVTRKLAPALAAGCTAVLKPAEATPLTAAALIELARRAGVPPGVVNLVSGDAPAIGEALLRSDAVRKLGFTGSTAVGKHLAARAADTVKRVSLELGGNAPFIVCADADVEAAATALAASAFRNAGQTCISASRVLAHESVVPALTAALAARVGRLRAGRGVEPGTTLGPLISPAAVDRVVAHVDDAVARGARLEAQGDRPAAAALADGYFARPSLLVGVDPAARVFREETFGPVLAVTPFARLDEAVALANDTPYGLAAYAFTQSMRTAWRLADGLDYGMVGVNDVAITAENAPFGGVKASGLGREHGRWGVAEFLDVRYVAFGGL